MEDEFQVDTTPDVSLRKKLNGMFDRYSYVSVRNPLKVQFKWQVALERNEILGMSAADPMNEEQMSRQSGGTFLPGDSVTKQRKVTIITLEPGETKALPGEAAYVIVGRLFKALVREKYGTDKIALAKLRNPNIQAQLIPEIIVGPIVTNVDGAIQTFVSDMQNKIQGFTDVQANPSPQLASAATAPKGFANPDILAKARATREANKARTAPQAA